jgi:perosamine synthetase
MYYCGHLYLNPKQLVNIVFKKRPIGWLPQSGYALTQTARTAIEYAIRISGLGQGSEILVPAYNCGSEVAALIKGGASVNLYDIKRDATIDIGRLKDAITSKTKAIYIIHYFGFSQPIREIKEICIDKGIKLLEDCALSLFSKYGDADIGTHGDFSFFSFPKSLPVPDGGMLITNNCEFSVNEWERICPNTIKIYKGLLPHFKSFMLHKISQYNMLWLYELFQYKHLVEQSKYVGREVRRSSQYLPFMIFDNNLLDKRISSISRNILSLVDKKEIVAKRRHNFKILLSNIKNTDDCAPLFNTLPEGVCPLHFPIIVKDRNKYSYNLNWHLVDAIEWWKGYYPGFKWNRYSNACYLKDSVIALPIHQQICDAELQYIIDTTNSIH